MVAYQGSATMLLTLTLATLLSSSVASLFVPASFAKLPQGRREYAARHLFVSGGSDEEARGVAQDVNLSSEEGTKDTDNPPQVPSPPSTQSLNKLGPNAAPPGFLRKVFPSFPWHRLPNLLTYVRCLAIPGLVGIFYLPESHIDTGVIFAVASFTDWLDGYLARRWDITSAFGAFLDPVADKLMVSTALILLAGRHGAEVAIPACIILAREIAVSALREWMAQRGLRDLVKVGFQGKVKTALTMFSLTVLLFVPTSGIGLLGKLYMPGLVMLYLCTLVTISSGSVYFVAAAPLLFEKD
jgi:CDP-diacylglycerol--glycerol-3-phosphate 3-phosphatidyltransferase